MGSGTALSFSFPAVMLFTRFLWENIGENPANGRILFEVFIERALKKWYEIIRNSKNNYIFD
jgi:hypothetical protein